MWEANLTWTKESRQGSPEWGKAYSINEGLLTLCLPSLWGFPVGVSGAVSLLFCSVPCCLWCCPVLREEDQSPGTVTAQVGRRSCHFGCVSCTSDLLQGQTGATIFGLANSLILIQHRPGRWMKAAELNRIAVPIFLPLCSVLEPAITLTLNED